MICCWDKVYRVGSRDPQNHTLATFFKTNGTNRCWRTHSVNGYVSYLSVMSEICKFQPLVVIRSNILIIMSQYCCYL